MKQQHTQSKTKILINDLQFYQEIDESQLRSVIGGSASRLPDGWKVASVAGGMLPDTLAPIGHC